MAETSEDSTTVLATPECAQRSKMDMTDKTTEHTGSGHTTDEAETASTDLCNGMTNISMNADHGAAASEQRQLSVTTETSAEATALTETAVSAGRTDSTLATADNAVATADNAVKTSAKAKIPERVIQYEDHATDLQERIAALLTDEQYIDLVVHVGTAQVRCHRTLLALASLHFMELLCHDDSQTSVSEITVANVDEETFRGVLGFIYRGDVILSADNVGRMMSAASQFRMEPLRQICLDFMRNDITAIGA